MLADAPGGSVTPSEFLSEASNILLLCLYSLCSRSRCHRKPLSFSSGCWGGADICAALDHTALP